MRLLRRIRRLIADERAASAVEFGLVVPLFALMTLGLYNLTAMLFAANSLHFAVERAARCVSLTPSSCQTGGGTPTLTTYATSQYVGPKLKSAVYSLTSSGATSTTNCGNQVHVAATYRFTTGLVNFDAPIQADSCFPA